MKEVIIFLLIVVFNINTTQGQESPCYLEIYTLAFNEAKLYKNKAVEIEIGYTPNKFISEALGKMDLLNEAEIKLLHNLPDTPNYSNCTDIKKEVVSLLSDDRIRENGSYMKYLFSRILPFSDTKKGILMYSVIKSKKYEGGKAIGQEIIYIFNHKKGNWVLTDKKSIATY